MKYTFILLALVMTAMISCQSSKGKKAKFQEKFKEMDINKDGKLSKDEVKAPFAKNFDERDVNKDGFITLEEIKNTAKSKKK